jgi:hypothetical protein
MAFLRRITLLIDYKLSFSASAGAKLFMKRITSPGLALPFKSFFLNISFRTGGHTAKASVSASLNSSSCVMTETIK